MRSFWIWRLLGLVLILWLSIHVPPGGWSSPSRAGAVFLALPVWLLDIPPSRLALFSVRSFLSPNFLCVCCRLLGKGATIRFSFLLVLTDINYRGGRNQIVDVVCICGRISNTVGGRNRIVDVYLGGAVPWRLRYCGDSWRVQSHLYISSLPLLRAYCTEYINVGGRVIYHHVLYTVHQNNRFDLIWFDLFLV